MGTRAAVLAIACWALCAGVILASMQTYAQSPERLGPMGIVRGMFKLQNLRDEAKEFYEAGRHQKELLVRLEALELSKAVHGETSHFVGAYENDVATNYQNFAHFFFLIVKPCKTLL